MLCPSFYGLFPDPSANPSFYCRFLCSFSSRLSRTSADHLCVLIVPFLVGPPSQTTGFEPSFFLPFFLEIAASRICFLPSSAALKGKKQS